MNRDQFIKKLHPAITHIRASDNMSAEQLDAINEMVEKVFHMSADEIKALSANAKAFRDFEANVAIESKNYPLLKKCNGHFNYELMRRFFNQNFTAIQACNAMVEAA